MNSDNTTNDVPADVLLDSDILNYDVDLDTKIGSTHDREEDCITHGSDSHFRSPSVASGKSASLVTVADALLPISMFRTLARSTLTTNQQMVCVAPVLSVWFFFVSCFRGDMDLSYSSHVLFMIHFSVCLPTFLFLLFLGS